MLWPFVLEHKMRCGAAFGCLLAAKVATVTTPLVIEAIVNDLDGSTGSSVSFPLGFLLLYGALRFLTTLFRELQVSIFASVRHGIMRRMSRNLMEHLHDLSLRFHLERKTGELTRDIDRGTNSLGTMLNYLLFNILPTLIEVGMVVLILVVRYDAWFAVISAATFCAYVGFTLVVTQWRMTFRSKMHSQDSKSSGQAIDSLLNYTTVKIFNNEAYEIDRYDQGLKLWQRMAVRVQHSLSWLNAGQGFIIAVGVTLTMVLAGSRVSEGLMSVGGLVAVNAFLIQLFLPLGFLGMVYGIVKNALSDMQRMVGIMDREPEVQDRDGVGPLTLTDPTVVFRGVSFSYDADRQILHDINLEIPAGTTTAVVGASGSGKSTLAKLLFRFYNVEEGAITVSGTDIGDVSQSSLRQAIGMVPQDPVLFNDTIGYNLSYGRLDAAQADLDQAIETAHLRDFIDSLPLGLETVVGERGLKLSGGEKQRVAIARAILKDPPLMIFDEATSSLDTRSEQSILDALRALAKSRTTLVIAHRLSTIVDAEQILVLDQGRIVERGTHQELLQNDGIYREQWTLQQRDEIQT
jgi:ATP-binding cassette, subfamily B, heavy metal transporter